MRMRVRITCIRPTVPLVRACKFATSSPVHPRRQSVPAQATNESGGDGISSLGSALLSCAHPSFRHHMGTWIVLKLRMGLHCSGTSPPTQPLWQAAATGNRDARCSLRYTGQARNVNPLRYEVYEHPVLHGLQRQLSHDWQIADVKQSIACRDSALRGGVSPAYKEGAALLRELGFDNQAEIARVLDIAMNPNSLFVTYRDKKRAVNTNARALSVEDDMTPVVAFLRSQGVSNSGLRAIVSDHPPVLSYSVNDRLKPFFEYLESVGIEDAISVVAKRPSLLGLDVDNNLRKIVDYLQANKYSMDDIIKYLTTTI